MFGGITEAVEAGVVEAPDTTDAVIGAVETDTEDTGAVGGGGLALAAWWQAARWRFFSFSAGPR